ncbi:MAG: hypothetical protein P1V97_16595 [Planctomycetota bacterium]|nr:hypothetical protein [Planctomycetota bacterium]
MITETLIAILMATGSFALSWVLSVKAARLSRYCSALQFGLFIYFAGTVPWTSEYTHWGQWLHCLRYATILGALPGLVDFIYGKRRSWRSLLVLFTFISVAFHIFIGEPKKSVSWPPGREQPGGVVLHPTRKSCAAAAGASYLRVTGIRKEATEAEVGEACHTDFQTGTKDKDLVAGLTSLTGREAKISVLSCEELKARTEPCLLFVSLNRDRAKNEKLFRILRDQCGWLPGEVHTVLFMGVADGKPGEDVEVVIIADPRIGVERWGITHFDALWDHRVLTIKSP